MTRISKSQVSVLDVLPVFRPAMGQEEISAVSEVIQSGWLGLGPKTEEFEEKFAGFVKSKYAIALNSATAALHLSLIALGVKKGDEILVPSLTFVSTAHVALYLKAKPVFVDIDKSTLCMDPKDLLSKITKKSKVIIPVHYGGHPADMDLISKIAKSYNLKIIEDASHAAGAKYKGKMIGSISDVTCFSFHAVKNLATGDGGMITTNDLKIATLTRKLRWLGINKDTWQREEKVMNKNYQSYGWFYDVSELGFKYHMNDIAAAIGIVQLKKLNKLNARRRVLFKRYNQKLKQFAWIKTPIVKEWAQSAHHNYVIQTKYRDKLNLYFKQLKISSGVHYMPIHLFSYYQKNNLNAKVPQTDTVWKNLLTLPLYPTLTYADQDRVIDAIKNFNSILIKTK